jgi:hypothetical protein
MISRKGEAFRYLSLSSIVAEPPVAIGESRRHQQKAGLESSVRPSRDASRQRLTPFIYYSESVFQDYDFEN